MTETGTTDHTAESQDQVLSQAASTQDGRPGGGCKTPLVSRVAVAPGSWWAGAKMGQAGLPDPGILSGRTRGPLWPL